MSENMKMRSEVLTVTPTMAERILEKNSINRPVSQVNVDRLTNAILRGEWLLTHQGIAYDQQGRLVDGQHRLLAIKAADRAVKMMVTHNLDPEAVKVIDLQRARTPADALTILTKNGDVALSTNAKKTAELASVISLLVDAHSGRRTPDQVIATVEKYRTGIEAVLRIVSGSQGRGLGKAPILGALAFAYQSDPAAVELFAEQYKTGAELAADSPVCALRNYVLSGVKEERRKVAVRTANCAAKFIKGERMTKTFATEDAVAFLGEAHGLKLKTSSADLRNFKKRQSRAKPLRAAGGV